MPALVCDAKSPVIFYHPKTGRKSIFNPSRKFVYSDNDYRKNPVIGTEAEIRKPLFAGKITVGFNVGDTPTWYLDDLIKLTRAYLKETKQTEDSTFIAQKGVYTHESGHVIQENGGQIVILDFAGRSEKVFSDDMIRLAELICTEFSQETVVLEIQRNGVREWSALVRA